MPPRGTSNEYPQHMFSCRNTKKYQQLLVWSYGTVLTKKRASNQSSLYRIIWFVVILATKGTKSTKMISEKFQIDKPVATSVTKACIALCTYHVITATFTFNKYLKQNGINVFIACLMYLALPLHCSYFLYYRLHM